MEKEMKIIDKIFVVFSLICITLSVIFFTLWRKEAAKSKASISQDNVKITATLNPKVEQKPSIKKTVTVKEIKTNPVVMPDIPVPTGLDDDERIYFNTVIDGLKKQIEDLNAQANQIITETINGVEISGGNITEPVIPAQTQPIAKKERKYTGSLELKNNYLNGIVTYDITERAVLGLSYGTDNKLGLLGGYKF